MSSASLSSALPPTASASAGSRRNPHLRIPKTLFTFHHPHHHHHPFLLRVTNETSRTEVSTTDPINERLESDKIVDGMDFGELCNEFECISSPLVESTARQLVRDILELREGNRALGTYAVSVKYKDPVRSFTGREKYKRPLWITGALENPTVRVQEMVMLSTSVLNIKWTIQGKPKSFSCWHRRHFFWTSRRLFATVEAAKDLGDGAKDLSTRFSTKQENTEVYPDPSGDPSKSKLDRTGWLDLDQYTSPNKGIRLVLEQTT
ncbi:hypothetical protein GOBAR_AA19022 [Gossypium barbadense]|uniref:Uncharacterized protein n=1 Tax=Gossypium barbadense TaxID=3634 RepID=A0A2P5XE79_GOSBA|nr:hypothetical protein GOBAR_AA19022 [Gossypium barbadense]